eukprot:gene19424-23259_t
MDDISIISIEKRLKEGGAYVHFRTTDASPPGETLEQVADRIEEQFTVKKRHFHFASSPAKSHLVHGKPFVDDIDTRIPSPTLRVYYKGAEMLADDLYRQLRPYGHIRYMYTPDNLPKDAAKYVLVTFRRMEGAIAARNCLHNEYLPEFGTSLYMDYELMMNINMLKDLFSKHPKIMIPLAGIIATLLTLLLFNPLREYFMGKKLTEPFYFEEIEDWQTRIEEKVLNSHFNYPPNSIVMISAPKGSGKSSLIDKILEGRTNTLLIDCNSEVNNNDEEFIENLSKDIGFFPSFGIYSNLVGWMDAILPTSKGAFHSTTNTQLQTILKILDQCIEKKAEKEFPDDPHQSFAYPLIVIDGFFGMIAAMENKEKAKIIMDSIIQWSITSTIKGQSHVVFISSDPFAGDILKKHLVNRGGGQVTTIHLGDVPPASAKEYIKHRLGKDLEDQEFKNIIQVLGGRYSDLNFLAQKVMSGERVPSVLTSMIAKAVGEIRADGFSLSKRNDTKQKEKEAIRWTRPQLWETIKRIAESNYVSYDDLLFNVFIGDETSLNNLIMSDILRFQSIDNERMVTAYSPLYRSAFKQMVDDIEFCVGMDIFAQKARIEEEMAKLSKVEDELLKLKNLKSGNWFDASAFQKRRTLLEEKAKDHVSKIETREKILKNHTTFQKQYQQQKLDKEKEADKISDTHVEDILATCDDRLLAFLLALSGIDVNRPEICMDQTVPTTMFHLAHATEVLFKCINNNFTGIIGKTLALTVYSLSNSTTVIDLISKVTGISRASLDNYRKDITDKPNEGIVPLVDVVVAYDNIQRQVKPTIIVEGNRTVMNVATVITYNLCGSDRLQFQPPETSPNLIPPTDTDSQFVQYFEHDTGDMANNIRSSQDRQRPIKFIQHQAQYAQASKDEAFEREFKELENTNILDIIHVNPSSEDANEMILEAIHAKVMVGGRKWVLIVVDGGPYKSIRKLKKANSSKYAWVVLRCGLLHEEMNMLKVINKFMWKTVGKTITTNMPCFAKNSSLIRDCKVATLTS